MDKYRALIYNFLYNFPLSGYADDDKKINILVSGWGQCASQLVRSLVWASQGDGYRIEITIIGARQAEKKFMADYPELFNTEKLMDSSDINYRITFSDNSRVPHKARVIFVCADSEADFSESLHQGAELFIMAADAEKISVPDFSSAEIITSDYNFCEDIISSQLLTNTARRVFDPWKTANGKEKDDEFFGSEFNLNSSCAAALFWLIRKKTGQDTEVSDKNMRLEHRRWNAYMRSEGYRYGAVRDNENKTHPCLVPYDELTEEIQAYDANPIRSIKDM